MRTEHRRIGSTLRDTAMVTLYVCIDRRVGNNFSKKEGLVALLSELFFLARGALVSQKYVSINSLPIDSIHLYTSKLQIDDTGNLACGSPAHAQRQKCAFENKYVEMDLSTYMHLSKLSEKYLRNV